MPQTTSEHSASIQIFGAVTAPDFPDWITRHAVKLGLRDISAVLQGDRVDVRASGSREMISALALACGLGPQSVMVDRVDLNQALKVG